jgi:ATP-dependent Clp protease ATP-binding subunit ClpX
MAPARKRHHEPAETAKAWEATTDAQLLASLKTAEASVDATRSVLQTEIDVLRKRGVSWSQIGSALSVSRQAAWERFS